MLREPGSASFRVGGSVSEYVLYSRPTLRLRSSGERTRLHLMAILHISIPLLRRISSGRGGGLDSKGPHSKMEILGWGGGSPY